MASTTDKPATAEDRKQEQPEQPQPPKRPLGERLATLPREHPLGLFVGLVLLVVAIVGGVLWWNYLSSYESTDDAQVDGHLNAVSSRVMGTVAGVYVVENQHVVVGQTLVDLDPRDLKVALERAQADFAQAQAAVSAESPSVPITTTSTQTGIASARAELANAEAGVGAAQRDYEAQVAQLRQAEATNAKAQADLARYTQLVRKDEISREEYDQRVASAKAAQAAVDSQRAAVGSAQKIVEQRRTQVSANQARLKEATGNASSQVAVQRASVEARRAAALAAKAALDQARLNLEYTKILAPVNGIVGRKSVEVGQRIQPGQELLSIVPLDDIWVTANFKETQLRHMRPGQSATIHVDAFDRDYDGYVESLPAASGARFSLLPPENASGNFVKVVQRLPVRLRFKPNQDPEQRLRPGMSAVPKVWLK